MVAPGEKKEEDGGKNEHKEVYHLETFWGDGTENGDRQAHYNADVKNVATDDIAYDEVGFFVFGGDDGGDELWEGSAEGDDSEGDDAV